MLGGLAIGISEARKLLLGHNDETLVWNCGNKIEDRERRNIRL
jgi:hypothetical protein